MRQPSALVDRWRGLLTVLALAAAVWPCALVAERMGYPSAEFTTRRQRLAAALGQGTLVMFGATDAAPGLRFRQDNDFFYLTGNESSNAALVMDAATGQSHLFLPELSRGDVQYEGPNWLSEPDAARQRGFTSIQSLRAFEPFLSRVRGASRTGTLWTRLSERDTVNNGREDTALAALRRRVNPLARYPNEDALRTASLKERFPEYRAQDVSPHLDRLRLIKSAREIDILRENARISADAMRRAIEKTAPGRFEYELEAEATHWMFSHGVQTAAYPAIVASGPMGNRWHYEDNGRRMNAGELVVMDYGGSLDYLTVDITRTWPVSGVFTDRQRRAYQTTLDAQRAILSSIRPGVTRETVRTLAQRVFEAGGFDARYAYVGHYVGLSVHDVGDWSLPFEVGMVMAIEPILDLPGEQMHIRIEDTVLVTPGGVEVLSASLPKDIDDLLPLVSGAR